VLGRPLVQHGLRQMPQPDVPVAQPRQQVGGAPESVGGRVADADGVGATGQPAPDAGEHVERGVAAQDGSVVGVGLLEQRDERPLQPGQVLVACGQGSAAD